MTEIFSRIAHSRTADEVVGQIEGFILEGVLRAGDRLAGERELARQFDVSRPILRDALKALEARGLIVTRPGGTHVADVTGQIFAPAVADLIVSRREAVTDYLEYRREIEGVAAAYAARRATEDDRALLARIIERMEKAYLRADFDEEASIDVEFHSAVGECAHNIILLHTLRACYRLLSEGVFHGRRLIYQLPGVRDGLLEQHRAIHRAVAGGMPEEAKAAAAAHIDFVAAAMAEAERTGDWQRVSRLRLKQRSAGERKARANAG